MYTRLFFACIAFLFFSSILAQCPTIPSADGDIDLNGLADENNGGGFSTTVSGWKYSVRICKNFDSIPTCVSDVAKGSPVSAYQEPVNPNICHFMGVKNEKSTYSLLDPTNPTNGVTVKYVDGEFAFGDYRSTQIDIICDSDDSKTFGCVSTGCEEKTGNVINYHFVLKSKYGCPGSGSGRPFLWPVGILGLLALLLIPVFIIYWPVGIIVNKFIRKKEGIEIVPNVTFWKDLPFLVKDGFLFLFKDIIYEKIITKIVAKVRGRPSYEPA